MVTQWRDKKDVSMTPTCVNAGTVIVKRAGKDRDSMCCFLLKPAYRGS